jgi:aspartate-semialdehyde dehydrogenase
MIRALNVAVIGATGNVGREIIRTLAERKFRINKIDALASEGSIGKQVSFGDDAVLTIKNLADYDFSDCDIAFFTAGGKISKEYCRKVAELGVIVIDSSSYFRMDKDVPLIIPEVNPEDLEWHKNIIASPNCSGTQMIMARAPLHELAGVKRVVASTYQSVSGAGKTAMDELFAQTKSTYTYSSLDPQVFFKQISFNVIPQIDEIMEDGTTKEEFKIIQETKKILDPDIQVAVTCVRVPVFIGHSVAMNIEFEEAISVEQAKKALAKFPGIIVKDERIDGGYITPKECVGFDEVFISRIREDKSVKHGLNLWVVSDNLRKGAATNAVQIAELIAKKIK